jgi:hypothetical protein
MDVVAANDVAERFAPVAATNPLGPLVRGELEGLPKFRPRAFARSSQQTRRWRKTDSNSRSLREGKGYGQPLQASIAVSDLNL